MIDLMIQREINVDKEAIAKQLRELADKVTSGEMEVLRSEIWKGDCISMSKDFIEDEIYLAVVIKSRYQLGVM